MIYTTKDYKNPSQMVVADSTADFSDDDALEAHQIPAASFGIVDS